MSSALAVENYYRVPGGAAAVRRVGDDLVRVDTGQGAGVVRDAERRFVWQYGGPADLIERIQSEQAVWDGWADTERQELQGITPLPPESRDENWWENPQYGDPGVVRTILETPELRAMKGMRILDIGGSVKDTWNFVWRGDAARVEQVDVSAESQLLGYRKLQTRFRSRPELVERFVFHTTAAEALPFADGSFDLVFSRSTIHHTSRVHAFPEIHRVLRPNGIFWMLEPRLPAPIYAVMKFLRTVRQAHRGTDDPLRNFELRRLGELMPIERVYGVRILTPYAKFLGASPTSSIRATVAKLDRAIVTGYIGRRLAHAISLVARKSR